MIFSFGNGAREARFAPDEPLDLIDCCGVGAADVG